MSLPWLPQERLLYRELLDRIQAGETLVRATIVRVWGSTPREVGAKMLVLSSGQIRGTVGGGCGEAEVWQAAQGVLTGGTSVCVHVDLTEETSSDSGKVCGGRFDVSLELWNGSRLQNLRLPLESALDNQADLALVTYLGTHGLPSWKKTGAAAPLPPLMAIGTTLPYPGAVQGEWGNALQAACQDALQKGRSGVWEWQGHDFFLDVLTQPLELIIAGAGHIGRPLCEMAALCGYQVTIVDDRPEYADPTFFPRASKILCQDFQEAFRSLRYHFRTHIVLVTRGHKYDEACLREAVGKPYAYMGMIGSKRRTRAVWQELREEGIAAAELDRVYAPIGLDIGAETPEEIAVCILGEMIQIRRGGRGGNMKLSEGHAGNQNFSPIRE